MAEDVGGSNSSSSTSTSTETAETIPKPSLSWQQPPPPNYKIDDDVHDATSSNTNATVIEIEELPPIGAENNPSSSLLLSVPPKLQSLIPPARPVKQAWRQRPSPHESSSGGGGNSGSSSNGGRSSRNAANATNNKNNNPGSKPKLTNLSLLNSEVAHTTLERCLLGVNGGLLVEEEESLLEQQHQQAGQLQSNTNNNNNTNNITINYSKQCKQGHVIDLLELRRLSSRGVPDEPPEMRARSPQPPTTPVPNNNNDNDDNNNSGSSSTHGNTGSIHGSIHSHTNNEYAPSSQTNNNNNYNNNNTNNNNNVRTSSSSANNVQSPTGNPHRSYRPLVWRVLLGYLPPQTDLWNDVLTRDRKLYANLVKELFSETCPMPHEVYDEGYLSERRRRRENECGVVEGGIDVGGGDAGVVEGGGVIGSSLKGSLKGNKVYRSDDHHHAHHAHAPNGNNNNNNNGTNRKGNDNDAFPHTPGQSTPKEPTTTSTTTPMTPGLLSARMQQEWIRGDDSIFNSPKNEDGTTSHSLAGRLSPMCAMNTPRVRSRKVQERRSGGNSSSSMAETITTATTTVTTKTATPATPGMEEELATISAGTDSSEVGDGGGRTTVPLTSGSNHDLGKMEEEVGVSGTSMMMNSLLLPDDGESDDDEDDNEAEDAAMIHIDHNNAGNGGCNESGKDEGVELCRTNSGGEDDDNYYNGISQSPSMDLDEEENLMLLDEVRKDVIRTHPDLRFFLEPKEDLGQKRYAALERILFVWAKLNKGVRYVQGMNEIVGTLYFVLAHDSNEDWAKEAEADTYFLFNSLMVEMRDVFVPDLDEADTGIHGRISNMINLLSLHDPEVRCHLDSVGIDPSFYSVRWLTTLLSREFLLPDTIRLWDSMFASTHKDNFLRYVSVTMVMVIRDQLLVGDFSACLRLLQAYPPTNLDRLLESSRALWIYESQITLACHKGGISLGHALRSIAPPPAISMAYGLPGGVAPPIGEQVRQAGERGLAAARGAANGASNTVANASRSFFGNAMGFWRSSADVREKKDKDLRRSKTTM